MEKVVEREELDQKKVNAIIMRVVSEEMKNLRTQEYTKGKMVDKIIDIIKEETGCY